MFDLSPITIVLKQISQRLFDLGELLVSIRAILGDIKGELKDINKKS
jgi:hypothetical protein